MIAAHIFYRDHVLKEKSCKVVTKFGFLKNVYFFKKFWGSFKQKFLFKPIILRLVLGEGGFKGNLPFFKKQLFGTSPSKIMSF